MVQNAHTAQAGFADLRGADKVEIADAGGLSGGALMMFDAAQTSAALTEQIANHAAAMAEMTMSIGVGEKGCGGEVRIGLAHAIHHRPQAADAPRASVPLREIGPLIKESETGRKIKTDQHVGLLIALLEQPIQHLLPRPDMAGPKESGGSCAAGNGQRDTLVPCAARAGPVDGDEMIKSACQQQEIPNEYYVKTKLGQKEAEYKRIHDGLMLAQRKGVPHMQPMLIETESTPNPATLKFLPGRLVMESGTRDFASDEDAEASPLAQALFTLGDVTGVFFGRDFVSVTIAPGAEWSDNKPDVLGIIMDHFMGNLPLFNAASAAGFTVPADSEDAFVDDPADADIVEQIKELIETRVRPAVANDGGDIVYRGFDKGNVYLKLQGACAGCPSSSATLKNGIESLLKHYVPEVTAVHAV